MLVTKYIVVNRSFILKYNKFKKILAGIIAQTKGILMAFPEFKI